MHYYYNNFFSGFLPLCNAHFRLNYCINKYYRVWINNNNLPWGFAEEVYRADSALVCILTTVKQC